MINEIAIVALFAMSLDLILGYTGIVSLGHAAFFGFGAYTAALFAKLVMPDPTVGLVVAIVLCAALGAIASVTILRGTDLTRLMVTLGTALLLLELANKLDWLTGGADGLQGVVMGPVLGFLRLRPVRPHGCLVFALGDAVAVPADAPAAFAVRRHAKGDRDNRLRAMAIGIPVSRLGGDLHRRRRIAGAAGAAGADHRLRLARRAGLRPLGRRAADAGDRRRGLALWRRERAPSSSSCCRTGSRP
jgi:branched-chain amino acid transport system permease protein